MTAPINNWTDIPDTDLTTPKAFSITTLFAIRNNIARLREMLSGSYTAGEAIDHNHDGVNSALIEVGPNLLRNGSFEAGLNGWTPTAYTGGTVVANSANAMHGIGCVAITSTVLANGGGEVVSNEYLPCAVGRSYSAKCLAKASVANVSSKVELIWYNAAKAQISSSAVTTTNTPTTAAMLGAGDVAPANAAFVRARLVGGVPATGSAVGTIYLDGAVLVTADNTLQIVSAGTSLITPYNVILPAAGHYPYLTEIANIRMQQAGIYRFNFTIDANAYGTTARIYRNGAAYGTSRYSTSGATFSEDLFFDAGDTMQIFLSGSIAGSVSGFSIGVDGKKSRLAAMPIHAIIGDR